MEVKRRKEAKKQNDFCGGKRHIATFQNYRNHLSSADQRKLGIDGKLLSPAVRRDGSGPGTFNGIGERKARSAPSNEFKSSTKGVKGEQYPLRHMQRDGRRDHPEIWRETFCPRASGRAIETAMRRLTSNDRNGAISYWIFTNKISSFRKLHVPVRTTSSRLKWTCLVQKKKGLRNGFLSLTQRACIEYLLSREIEKTHETTFSIRIS